MEEPPKYPPPLPPAPKRLSRPKITLQIPTSPYAGPPSASRYSTPNKYVVHARTPESRHFHPNFNPEWYLHMTQASDFIMNTAKSGLSFGEKTALWIVSKLKHLSKRWFTHFFLMLCLVLYSVMGAGIFMYLEVFPIDEAVRQSHSHENYASNLGDSSLFDFTHSVESTVNSSLIQVQDSDLVAPSEESLSMELRSYTFLNNVTFNLSDDDIVVDPITDTHLNSDVVEPSEEDIFSVNTYMLARKKVTDNLYLDVSSQDCSPISPNANEDHVSCPLTISSADVTDNMSRHLNSDLTTNNNTLINEPSTSDLQQTARKQKIFTPKEQSSRKRKRNPQEWKRKREALSREKGEEYTSYNNKKVAKKDIKEGLLCNEKCWLKCSDKFSIDQRKKILNDFYTLDINGKNALIFNSMKSTPVVRKRKGAQKHKTLSYKYFIFRDGVTEEVCKLGLCSLYQIGRGKIDHIQNQIKKGASVPKPDCRGRHSNRPHKVDSEVSNKIKNHIASFPSEESHYSRHKNIFKRYLSPLLNVTKMHQLYIDMCNAESLPKKFKITKTTYNQIFVTEYNLSFGYPRSDTCAICDEGKCTEEHTESHQAAVEAMRSDRDNAKTSEDVTYITIDLQQTMPLPKIPTSKAFYLRQIWFYNLGIHNVKKDKENAIFCTWTEDVADRGSCEVASALLRFVEIEQSGNSRNNHLIIWSDSCAGQNKNFNMICLYQYMILKGYYKVIDHKFPQVGHSYLDSDRDFGRIEKVLRRHESIFVPEQYRDIIRSSSKYNQVLDMSRHFRKISELTAKLKLINRKKDLNKSKIRFRDGIRWIRVEEFGSYLYKETYDIMTPFQKVDIMKVKFRPDDFILERISGKYGTISHEKRENIKDQLKYVKLEFKFFYDEILLN